MARTNEELKPNKESVREYHKNLKDMKIRFPRANEEHGIPDYAEIIKSQAAKLGKSVNEYVLDLIENDIQNNPDGINDQKFIIERSARGLKNNE